MRCHLESVVAMATRPSESHGEIASLSSVGTITVWSLKTHEELFDFAIPDDRAISAAYHPQHNTLACGFASGFVRVFDVDTAEVTCARQQHSDTVSGVCVSPDGERMFSVGDDGLLVLYDVLRDHAPVRVIHVAQAGARVCMTMSADGERLAYTGPAPHMVCVVHGITLDEIMAVDLRPQGLASGVAFSLAHIAYSAGGEAIFAVSRCGRLMRLSVATGDIEADVSRAHSKPVTALAVHPDGRFLVTGCEDASVTVS